MAQPETKPYRRGPAGLQEASADVATMLASDKKKSPKPKKKKK